MELLVKKVEFQIKIKKELRLNLREESLVTSAIYNNSLQSDVCKNTDK